ncbi:transmembrane protein 25 isoform X1 [Alosa sapidissima]|uniref:transmembrane protein 25 isoform X1 n=1 Tax=Alosa sapidissima TaxID=34773 RepID=UPI001C0A4B18|nr:transmembrane protein 25 isoform X1 [Alosa sapidissima]XP_041919650.1 transmembrane protein 25 isoform X1 [Alosa sapidissima]
MHCGDCRPGAGTMLLVLVLHTFTWAWTDTGAIEHGPRIDGKRRSTVTLQENNTRQFNCQSDGWNSQAPPLLTWYLNGQRQRQPASDGPERLVVKVPGQSWVQRKNPRRNSTFSLKARRWDRELVCATSNPASGESYNATVVLNVQFQPEILRVNAHYSDTSDPGLSLVLFALVRSNPPATITWVDQSGQQVANTSDFLILDSESYPWLSNHTLRVAQSSLAGNVSVNANNSVGAAQSNLTLSEFLQSRVEVPVLGIVTGGVLGFVTLLILTLIVLCLLHKGKDVEEPVELTLSTKCTDSSKVPVDGVYLPRENMSLPSHVQLNDMSSLCKARQDNKPNPGEKKVGEEEEEDLSEAYAARGFARYPMVGYIYKVNSVSSEEIWL